jgi:PAS domain S-box-containing protein
LRTIIDAAPIPTVVSKLNDGKILFANEHMAKLMGSSVEELTDKATPDFYYSPEERKPLLDRLQRDRVLHNCELRLKRLDGTPFWALVPMAISDLNGVPVIIAGISDIEKQKSAEEALQKERNLLEQRIEERTAEIAAINMQLLENERRLRKQNEALAALARRQVPSEEPDISLKILTEAAAEALEVERVSVWLYDQGYSRIVCLDLYEKTSRKHSSGFELSAAE